MRSLKLLVGTHFFELLFIEVVLSLFDLWADVVVDLLNFIGLLIIVLHRVFINGV